ncbi:MAG: hypothetical protein V1725_01590 [archaeon]
MKQHEVDHELLATLAQTCDAIRIGFSRRDVAFGPLRYFFFTALQTTRKNDYLTTSPIHRQVLRYAPDPDEFLAIFKKKEKPKNKKITYKILNLLTNKRFK